MARTRLIRPAFFKHAALYDAEVAWSLPLRVAFAGIWTVTDRRGRFPWKPREIKTDALPHDAVDFGRVLDALEAEGFVQRYVVDGKVYGLIPSFPNWQTFHKSEPASQLPDPVGPPLPPRLAPVVSPLDVVAVAVVVCDTSTVTNDDDKREPPDQSVGQATWQPSAEVRVAKILTTSAGRNALSAVLAVSGSKAGVIAEFEALLSGSRGAHHHCNAAQLDLALSDYVTNGMSSGRWNAQHFRACVRRAMQPSPETGPITRSDKALAGLNRMFPEAP